MGNYDDPELTGRTARARWPIVLTAVLALLVGGGAGYAGRALTTEPPAPVVVAAPPVSVPPAVAPPSTATCTAAAEAGAALAEQLQLAATAIRDLDPGALRAILDRVQQLQAELEAAVRACSAGVPPGPAPGTPPR